MRRLADQLVVLRVWANPKPHDTVRGFDADRPIMSANARRPEAADFLEMKRWGLRIPFQLLETSIREALNRNGKGAVTLPILRRCVVVQSFVVAPDA